MPALPSPLLPLIVRAIFWYDKLPAMSMVVNQYCTWDLGRRGDKENTYGAFSLPDLWIHKGGGVGEGSTGVGKIVDGGFVRMVSLDCKVFF